MEKLTDDLVAKPKRAKGRPKKNFNLEKTYELLDESAYKRALRTLNFGNRSTKELK